MSLIERSGGYWRTGFNRDGRGLVVEISNLANPSEIGRAGLTLWGAWRAGWQLALTVNRIGATVSIWWHR